MSISVGTVFLLGVNAATETYAQTQPSATAAGRASPPRLLPPAPVQWQSVLDQIARVRASRKGPGTVVRLVASELDKTELPVILPREGIVDTIKAKLISFGDAYALDLPQKNGVHITMYGNRNFLQVAKGAISNRPAMRLKGVAEDIRVAQMEDGWTATFMRFGVVYSLDVSCDDPAAPECKSDGYLKKILTEFDDVGIGSKARAAAARFKPPGGLTKTPPDAARNDQKGAG
ncbi:hypothetical protein AEAC466_11860 [Asticcacaulis sp. AC466]|nr:hypothetical protein AEAC466_11860 [Asticcacaulis sp. AC466]